MDELSCRLIRVEHIDDVWTEVKPYIDRCVPHSEGELETEDFYDFLANGEMQLWIAIDKSETEDNEIIAAMITQIIVYPRKRILRIIAIAGDEMDRWMHFLPEIEDRALEAGCTAREAWGRKGWLKVLTDWKCSYHVLTKDLKSRMH